MIIKYAEHVRHDFEMSGREFKHCQTKCICPAVVNVEEMSGRKDKGCQTFLGSNMSGRVLKCAAEPRMFARHFAWHADNNFDNHCG